MINQSISSICKVMMGVSGTPPTQRTQTVHFFKNKTVSINGDIRPLADVLVLMDSVRYKVTVISIKGL